MIRTSAQACDNDDPVRRRLAVVGLGSLPIYGLIAILSTAFRYGEGYQQRPIPAVLGLLALAWVGYAVALAGVLGRRRSVPVDAERREFARDRMRLILGGAVAFRLILLVSRPIQEIDYYRYLWDGRVTLSGLNPFQHAPAEIDRLGRTAALDSPLGRLWRLAHTTVPVRTIFERVHHREVPTIYPPASQAVFALAALLTPMSAPVGVHVLALKSILAGFDVGTLLILACLLRRLDLPVDWCLAYGWCPLVLKEFANTGHLDAIAVFFTVLAAYWLVGTAGRSANERRVLEPVLGAIAFGLAVLAKSYPVVLLPIVAAFLVARQRGRAIGTVAKRAGTVPILRSLRSKMGLSPFRRAVLRQSPVILPALAFATVVLAGYLPFLVGPRGTAGAPAHSPWTGLGMFLARWQKNDFLFMLVHENLRPPAPGVSDRWFVVVPREAREAIDHVAAAPLARFVGASAAEPAFLLTQAVMGATLATIVLVWAARVFRTPEPRVLLRGTALILAWGWLLSSTPHPWYLAWSLPFLVFTEQRSWFLLPGLALVYYVRFYLEYQAAPFGQAAIDGALETFDYGLVWLEFVPFFAALAVETRRDRTRSRHKEAGPPRPQLPSEGR